MTHISLIWGPHGPGCLLLQEALPHDCRAWAGIVLADHNLDEDEVVRVRLDGVKGSNHLLLAGSLQFIYMHHAACQNVSAQP
jgi:hypothetical protein